ncbi:General amino acid permease [Ceratobasidium theobromae]|uniref:General amino acid permease n=1 Tax=Ceratobasidium theobromae TaxID=1582974 RepID=A0A5N5QGF7_9AGAM|nr:General amino acid permease [Ceratobasidium theobromae]
MSHEEKDSYADDKEKGTGVYTTHVPIDESDPRYHFDPHDLGASYFRHRRPRSSSYRPGTASAQATPCPNIAGTIGTGLFLGSGKALARAGPAGALIAYIHVGSVAYSSLCAVGEMTCFAPVSGTFPHFAARWVDPAFGFAVGWNYFYVSTSPGRHQAPALTHVQTQSITVPVEVTAAQIILTFWDKSHTRGIAYTAIIIVFMCSINLFGVRYFGESEFFFAIIKLTLITGLILVGLIIDLGGGPDGDRRGFRYWKNPGAFNTYLVHSPVSTGRFLGILGVLVQAAFSFQGMELVAVAASETENPRRNIAKAVRRVFYRILIFYILGILITGMIVPYNNPDLLQDTGTSAQSPYVIAIHLAGIKVLPHIINACVFTSAFSAGNSFLYTASRILYGLAVRGQAPRIFAKCTRAGLPIVAVLTCSCFALLSFMNVSTDGSTVFNWLVNLTTIGGFFTWCSINITYIRFYRGLKAQGIDRKQLIYYSVLQPWLSYWGVFWTGLFILINGFAVFFDFDASDFFTCYINVPIFFGLFIGWKLYKRTKFWKTSDMDFTTGVPSVQETESPEVPPKNLGEKIFNIIF